MKYLILLILSAVIATAKAQTTLFESTTAENSHYRIPAIVSLNDGTLMAFSDSRENGGADIGYGWIDIVYKTSADNGKTWSEQKYVVKHFAKSGLGKALGDASTVVDRKTGDVLLMASAGDVGFLMQNPNDSVRIASMVYSAKKGTWSAPVDISDRLYVKGDRNVGHLFFSSGRMIQSRKVKVGSHYRIYGAVNTRVVGSVYVGGSCVVYSDDFGATWHYLGGIGVTPIDSGDECKVEELPDGSILLNARLRTGESVGRGFNVFTFTNIKKAEGSWGTKVHSGETDIEGQTLSGGCNAELLLVKAKRAADGKRVNLLLLSSPMATTRNNVGIYYKELPDNYHDPKAYVDGWRKYMVTNRQSAYSTMIPDSKANIAFLYEEDWREECGYNIVFKSLPLQQITGGSYLPLR